MTNTGRQPVLQDKVEAAILLEDSGRSLVKDSLKFLKTLALSVGIQGPTAGVIVGPAIIASIVGSPGALAQVIALVTMGFVAYAFVVFSRSFNTSSSVYAFNGTALGAGYGFVSGWVLLLVYTSFAAGVYAATADITQTFFASLGISLWWIWYALIGAILSIVLAYLSISVSSIVILACEGVSIILISIVGMVVMAKGGYRGHGLTASPFEPHGVAIAVLALGIVGAFGQFSGFEGATTLGEETRRPTSNIPKAVIGSLVLSAGVYIFFTWIVYSAFPTAGAVAADPAPLVHVADTYLSPTVGKIVNAAGIISAFGAQLACLNAASRLLFALGREGGDRNYSRNILVRTSRAYGSPAGALAVVGAVSLSGLLAFASEKSANRAATLLIQYGSYLILVVYLMTVIGALVWTIRTQQRRLSILVLVFGVGILGYVSYRTFTPLPAFPFNWVLLAAGISIFIGGLLLLITPELYQRMKNSPMLKATASGVDIRRGNDEDLGRVN